MPEIHNPPLILAIESSCDDTSVALVSGYDVLSNIVSSQYVHAKYGGVVPELASRAHLQNISGITAEALRKANKSLTDVDAIAVTLGPGLLGSLMVGVHFAKALALSQQLPLIGVDHMQAHIHALFAYGTIPMFPCLCLTVSGGHTLLTLLHSATDLKIIGQTVDDAAGEAFDKVARMLGFPYPGGPALAKSAENGNAMAYSFSSAQMSAYDFSFSGFKTSVLYTLQKEGTQDGWSLEKHRDDLAASAQKVIVDMLMQKVKLATQDIKPASLAMVGGVASNQALRSEMKIWAKQLNLPLYVPEPSLCTDNAAMIGLSAQFLMENKKFAELHVVPYARHTIGES